MNPPWTEEADVVVIGGGLAGHCAALELAAAGAEVLLLEKEERIGGSPVISGGSFAFAGTELQRRKGIEDSSEILFEDLRRVGGFRNDEAIVRAYVDNQLDTYHWLDSHGVVYENIFLAAGHSVPRGHSRNPREVIEILSLRVAKTGQVRTCVCAPVRRLIRSGLEGPVEGVLADVQGEPRAIKARRGVILASGGFSRNEQLLKLFAPSQEAAMRVGGAGNTGDGLVMAWHLGAGMRDMGHIKGTFGGHPSASADQHAVLLPIYVGAIAVNSNAERFVDESISYKLIGDAVLKQPDAIGFQIFDRKIYEKGTPGIPTMAFQMKHQMGQVVNASTIAELAKLLGVDPDRLEATVARYNADIEEGKDRAFGRTGLSTGYGKLTKIDTAPYYGYASKSVVLATYCGVAVDREMRVRDVFDAPIPNLYAAGEVMGGFHGSAYMTGSALGKAAIFGRLAARSALGALVQPGAGGA